MLNMTAELARIREKEIAREIEQRRLEGQARSRLSILESLRNQFTR